VDSVIADAAAPRSRYRLIGKIASGGMGTVYLGTLRAAAGFTRLVAVKLIHPHLAEEPRFVDMFLDEARLAGRLEHPNVVGILDVGSSNGRYYEIMPYVEGGTLAELVRRTGERSPAMMVPLIVDTLLGLHAAHTLLDERGQPLRMVHRDVCPSNILVGVDGAARITDFGVAKAALRVTHTLPGVVKGKLSYMAPEQAIGHAVDARADQFAVGVILWSALTGRPLFRTASDDETFHRLFHLPVPRPSEIDPRIPASLDPIVPRALERPPAKRWPTAADMAEALREAALAAGMYASPTQIGTWVSMVFADRIAIRREAVARALATTPEQISVVSEPPPPLPVGGEATRSSMSDIPLPPPPPPTTPVSASQRRLEPPIAGEVAAAAPPEPEISLRPRPTVYQITLAIAAIVTAIATWWLARPRFEHTDTLPPPAPSIESDAPAPAAAPGPDAAPRIETPVPPAASYRPPAPPRVRPEAPARRRAEPAGPPSDGAVMPVRKPSVGGRLRRRRVSAPRRDSGVARGRCHLLRGHRCRAGRVRPLTVTAATARRRRLG